MVGCGEKAHGGNASAGTKESRGLSCKGEVQHVQTNNTDGSFDKEEAQVERVAVILR